MMIYAIMQIYCPNCKKYLTITNADLQPNNVYVNCPDCNSELYVDKFAPPITEVAEYIKKIKPYIIHALSNKTGVDISNLLECRIVYIPVGIVGIHANIEIYKDNISNNTKIDPIYSGPLPDMPAEYTYAFLELSKNISNKLATNLNEKHLLSFYQLEKAFDYNISILAATKDSIKNILNRLNVLNTLNNKYLSKVSDTCDTATLDILDLKTDIVYKAVFELYASVLGTEYRGMIDPYSPTVIYNTNLLNTPNLPSTWNA